MTVTTLLELYRSHWALLQKTITVEVLDLMMSSYSGTSEQHVALAELLLSSASLNSLLSYVGRYTLAA